LPTDTQLKHLDALLVSPAVACIPNVHLTQLGLNGSNDVLLVKKFLPSHEALGVNFYLRLSE